MRRPENIWSRRRAAVLAEAKVETKAAERAEAAFAQAEMAEKSDSEVLQKLNLKDPDQLQQGDDFTAFMQNEVPERLRQRALRTLWRSNPVLACVDDLVEYGDDFKAEWDGADLIKTVYRVGKGMLPDVEEAPEIETPESQGADVEATDDKPEHVEVAELAPEPAVDTPQLSQPSHRELTPPSEPMPPRCYTRRMRFEFDEVT